MPGNLRKLRKLSWIVVQRSQKKGRSMLRPYFVYFVRFVVNNFPSFLADSRRQPVARMKQSVIRESLDSVLLHPGDNVFSLIARQRFFNGARVF
jgi:hypothetical protein